MAHSDDIPHTQALRWLEAHKVPYTPHLYTFEEHGGTRLAATSLGLDEHLCIKTIVLETDTRKPLICLMHGDREISLKNLARTLEVKTITPCTTDTAQRHTGYFCGGTSPFGTRKNLPVFVQKTILDHPTIYINGGRRGLLVAIPSQALTDTLKATPVDAMQ
ncbi:MAG: aminoacyl-tRNA deacylase [Kiritimatiellia bacterium]|nr:aminoacyl-tRNA deacylase [Kiritimatiellia bacterium]